MITAFQSFHASILLRVYTPINVILYATALMRAYKPIIAFLQSKRIGPFSICLRMLQLTQHLYEYMR